MSKGYVALALRRRARARPNGLNVAGCDDEPVPVLP